MLHGKADQHDNKLSTEKTTRARPVICANHENANLATEDFYAAVASVAAVKAFVTTC